MEKLSFFSISFDLLPRAKALGFDLYINSSSLSSKQKFVHIFKSSESFEQSDFERLKKNYPQLYVREDQRDDYLRSITQISNENPIEASAIIKESAIHYLETLFDSGREFSNELLVDTVKKSKVAIESMIDVLDNYSLKSLGSLIGNLSVHDFYTYDHSINVSMYCIILVKALKPSASRNELIHAGLGGLLHDLGKVKISTSILNSPEGLTVDEYQEIKKHPKLGIDLLLENQAEFEDIDIQTIGRVIHEHHENWDGTGYPQGLEGKQIHLLARVCAIVDFFDAITTKRSYSDVMPLTKALAVMENTCGKKIDEKIFKVFKNHLSASNTKAYKKFVMEESFDPTIPYHSFPLKEVEAMFTEEDFGKIRILDQKNKGL